ncbi:cysteine--tRNA ligase [Candidatus Kaiserbacteria bacterium]|nr:cysteine--tRNA ligase [Candidatus Kaiserbacteria bacterium]
MPLFLCNTLSDLTEHFEPRNSSSVTMYTCGPTVYDYVHIGNMRAYVFADILKRTLGYNGFAVNHTINITDFGHLTDDADAGEDKVMLALQRSGKPINLENMRAVTSVFAEAFKEDMDAIGNLPPSQYTRASDYVGEQIALIRTLVEKGYTYRTRDGIYFDISRFPAYGRLGNINLAAQKEGARIETNPEKKHPADFALWKFGELGWDSVWGKGFPGWHIECTAMAFATLGKQIDIHTGGIDHIATHHNGEIAQAESATGKSPYVRYWMHGEFITIDATKISKSLRNGITLRQLRDRGYSPLEYRYWLLTGHYKSPMNFTFEALDGAKQALFRLKRFVVEGCARESGGTCADGVVIESYREQFHHAINNNLDTPRALALIWELVKDTKYPLPDKAATIKHFDAVFGLRVSDISENEMRSLNVIEVSDLPDEVQKLLSEREHARKRKDWDGADALREAINLKGYLVEDTPKGVRVTKA